MSKAQELKDIIIKLSKDYYSEVLKEKKVFSPGDRISYAGRVYDEQEIINLIDASLDFWLTAGKYAKLFEEKLAEFLEVKFCHLCNSGSSANLLAFMALTSPYLKERRVLPGDEIITVASGFPTTISPIVQYGAIPVFVDVTIPQYNIDTNILEDALSAKTKAVMVAHTLGNPFDLEKVRAFCNKHNLWLIEDNCDSLGSMYFIDNEWRYTGTIGDIGTSSFYPPHHITTGEGGAVYTNNEMLSKIIVSLRDWGRDCVCPSGVDNVCKNRFSRKYGDLPYGYDHKYVYSHFGYNLKLTDMQAAVGVAQIQKLSHFISRRRENWKFLYNELKPLSEYFILPEPCPNSIPSWFGFLLTVRENSIFTRDGIVKYLEKHNIQTRMLFAGNIVKHPCFDLMRKEKKGYRIVGKLSNSDIIMNQSFWIGVYPEIDISKIEYIVNIIRTFIYNKKRL